MPNMQVRIDFDSWHQLAQQDPEAFERRRQAAIDEIISKAPEDQQHRLKCLQWRVDQLRGSAKTPLAACLKMSKMLWDRVLGKGGLMMSLDRLSAYSKAYPNKPDLDEVAQTGRVLSADFGRQAASKEKIVTR